jgi:hypothetical protein
MDRSLPIVTRALFRAPAALAHADHPRSISSTGRERGRPRRATSSARLGSANPVPSTAFSGCDRLFGKQVLSLWWLGSPLGQRRNPRHWSHVKNSRCLHPLREHAGPPDLRIQQHEEKQRDVGCAERVLIGPRLREAHGRNQPAEARHGCERVRQSAKQHQGDVTRELHTCASREKT